MNPFNKLKGINNQLHTISGEFSDHDVVEFVTTAQKMLVGSSHKIKKRRKKDIDDVSDMNIPFGTHARRQLRSEDIDGGLRYLVNTSRAGTVIMWPTVTVDEWLEI